MPWLVTHWLRLPPRARELWVAMLLPLTLMALFLAGEGLLRWQQYQKFGTLHTSDTEVDSPIWEMVGDRQRPRPSAKLGKLSFSADGFRGPKLTVPKPSGVIRVGFFGSSITLDPYVTDDTETWPAVVLHHLADAYPACRFDFFNAGVMGYNIQKTLLRFEEDAKPFAPDLTVLQLSDMGTRAIGQLRSEGHDIGPYRPSVLARASLLWLKLEKTAEALRLTRLAGRLDKAHPLDQAWLRENLRPDINRVADTILAAHSLPVFIELAPLLRRGQPLTTQLQYAKSRVLYTPGIFIGDIVEAYYSYNQVLAEVAATHDIPLIQTMDAFPADPQYYVDSSHTSRLGSRHFGEVVAHQLIQDPRVRALVRERGNGCLPEE
ncbi:hypothetical protein JCM17960_29200 [Magnetospira thiophila]